MTNDLLGRSVGMRVHAAPLFAATVLAACGTSGAAAVPSVSPQGPAHCGPAGAPTLAASSKARVYVVGSSVFGCSVSSPTKYRLGSSTRCLGSHLVRSVTVAGPLAAYGVTSCGVDTAEARVVVKRLTDGSVVLDVPAITHVPGPESFESVRSIVAKHDGAVAWIAVVSSIGHPKPAFEVHRMDSSGTVLLDSGSRIAPGSLRLNESTVTWKHGGATRTATLI